MNAPTSAAPTVSFAQALLFWLKLGLISFGGPAGQIAIMQRELVDERRWISQARFNHALNYCMLLPGPEAQQLATYIGWLMHRTPGALVAGGLFVLPSFFILLGLSWAYLAYGNVPAVAAVLWGAQCAVAAIVVHALWRVLQRTMPRPSQARILLGVAVLSFLAMVLFALSFVWIVLVAGVLGWWGAKRWPAQFAGAAQGALAQAKGLVYVIDEHSPTPSHAQFSRAKLLRALALGLLLWAVSMAALIAWQGVSSSLTQMAWFFSKAALVTFGGAYAVLPYVTQTALAQQWLTPDQMMAGLALGETTPGPLIMIVAFVGYVGQSQQVLRSAADPAVSGMAVFWMGGLGALVATWFTFLPSFVFILAGGPFVEATQGQLGFMGPLKAISAAVVGAIAALALLFVDHALRLPGGIDWAALALMLLAGAALFYRKWGVISVLLGCAVLGLARSFM